MLYSPYLREMLYAQGLKNPRQFGMNVPPPSQVQLPMSYGDVSQLQLPPDMQVGVSPIDLSQQWMQPQIAQLPTLQAEDAQKQVTQPQVTQQTKKPDQKKSGDVLSNFNDAMRTFVQSPLFTGIMNAARLIAASEEPKSDAYKEAVAAIFEGNVKAKQRQDLEQSLVQRGFSPQEASVMASNKDAMNALIQLRQQQQTTDKYGKDVINVDTATGTALVQSGDRAIAVPVPGGALDNKRRVEYKQLTEQYYWYSQMNAEALRKIDQLLPLVQKMSPIEMGYIGEITSKFIPNTPRAQVDAFITALKSNEGFIQLARFKNVGGTLGQVTQGEHALLQQLFEVLHKNQDPKIMYTELLHAKKRLQENRIQAKQAYDEEQKYYHAIAEQQQRYYPNDFVPFAKYEAPQSEGKEQSPAANEQLEAMTWQEAERRGVKSYYDIMAGGIVDRY